MAVKSKRKYLITGAIVLLAVVAVLIKYWTFLTNPWTRDGQVQANVIEIVPRVSGPIVTLPIRDNQFVRAGDLLFEIDPRTYQASLDQARAQLDQTGDNVQALTKQVESARAGVGASHQTGWSGAIARIMHLFASMEAHQLLEGGEEKAMGEPPQPGRKT